MSPAEYLTLVRMGRRSVRLEVLMSITLTVAVCGGLAVNSQMRAQIRILQAQAAVSEVERLRLQAQAAESSRDREHLDAVYSRVGRALGRIEAKLGSNHGGVE